MSDIDTDLQHAFEQADSTERLTPTETPTEVAPQQATPEQATQPLSPAEKRYIEAGDEDFVRFKVGGQVVEKAWKEVMQTQALLPGDYTRKMQALSTERQSFHSERDSYKTEREQFIAERTALAQALQDPRKIEALYLAVVAKQGGQAQPAMPQQGEPQATPAQRTLGPEEIANLVESRLQERDKQAAIAHENGVRGNALEKHVDSILTNNPALKAIPEINDYLYSRVMRMVVPGQTSVEEAMHYLDMVATEAATGINSHFNQAKKLDAVADAQLRNGIEPRGGSPVTPSAKRYDPKKGLDDDEMEKDIIAYLKSMSAGA